MSGDTKDIRSSRQRAASGLEPTEIADVDSGEGFVSGEYSEVATRIVANRGASGRQPAVCADVTIPSVDAASHRVAVVSVTEARRSSTAPRTARTLAAEDHVDGRYRIVDLIARGSMSRVYLAEHVSVNRLVALKVINRDLVGEAETVKRFLQEARVLARISHPNVVSLYDIGETATGDPYIVMEYMRGASLAAILKEQGRLDAANTLALMLQIVRGVGAVHDTGIIHRDLKPSNVLVVRRDDGSIRAKLADFGLAKVTQDRAQGDYLTRAGSILGTPEYMAPEQVKGTDIDRRVDLYSLGCMAYELLAGTPPFVGQEMATLYKQLHEAPKPLAQAAADADVPEALAAVVHKALQKDPEERYATAHELYRDLLVAAGEAGISRRALQQAGALADHDLVDDEQSTAVAPAWMPRRSPRRRLLILGAATVAALALVIGVAIGRFVERPGDAVPVAVAPAPAATGLVIDSSPDHAMVSLDGSKPKRAPARFTSLEPGPHRVVVERPGFEKHELKAVAIAGETGVVTVELQRPTYECAVTSEPAGATVELDGEPAGKAPTRLTLSEGEFHEITVHRAGFQTTTRLVAAGERVEQLAAQLRPALLEYGSLFVDSETTARVVIDGQDTSEWTPTGEIQLSPGRHTIELVDRVGTRRAKRIKLHRSDVERLRF